jgi:hypothetical protein
MDWMRFHPHGYEVSSSGDKRFSAIYARLPDGRTIEEAYQLDIKGYRKISNDWRVGKGRSPIKDILQAEMWVEYLNLWQIWAHENPELITELRQKAHEKILTDKFATSRINQANALAVICSELDVLEGISVKHKMHTD